MSRSIEDTVDNTPLIRLVPCRPRANQKYCENFDFCLIEDCLLSPEVDSVEELIILSEPLFSNVSLCYR